MTPETIFDLFVKAGYCCTLCGAFRKKKSQMRQHVRSFHGDRARAEAERMATQ